MNIPNEAPAPGQVVIARQAVFDAQGHVVGYELFDRSLAADAHTAHSDAELLFKLLTHADHAALDGNATLFINCTHASLRSGHLELIHPERVVLDVPPVAGDDAAAIAAALPVLKDLRRRDFRLAFSQEMLAPAYAQWLPLAAYVKLDCAGLAPDELTSLVAVAQEHSLAELIAEKVETAEQRAGAQALGIGLFQGYFLSKPEMLGSQGVRPARTSVESLLRLLRENPNEIDVERLLKRDAALAYNLLHFIQSSGLGLHCEVTSLRHAVMILGLPKLYRWASLLRNTSPQMASAPTQWGTAVARGRLMELLAADLLPPEEHDGAYLTGMFSLLDAMLGLPMEQALASVPLPDSVSQALLQGQGLFAPLLDLVRACESDDQQAFVQGLEALHLTGQQVNLAHLQALDWAGSRLGGL